MKNIPNILSFFRILLIPLFILQLLKEDYLLGGSILVVSGLTDFLDGFLARKYNWITDFGKILDPIADKLTQTALSLTLAYILKQYWIFFAIMILKDLIMLLVGSRLIKKGVKLDGAKIFGKVSTFSYYIGTILIVLIPNMPKTIVLTILILTTFLGLLSMFLYIPQYKKYKESIKS